MQQAAANIVSIKQASNLKAVLMTGDYIYGDGLPHPENWQTLTSFVYTVSSAGIPVLMVSGNHDNDSNATDQLRNYTNWNTYFPVTWLTNQSWWTGELFTNATSSGGVAMTITNAADQWLFVGLPYSFQQSQVNWLTNRCLAYTNHNVVFFSHLWLTKGGTIYTASDSFAPIWSGAVMPDAAWSNNIAGIGNLSFTLSGHDISSPLIATLSTNATDSHTVNMMFYNWQSQPLMQSTVLRLFKIDPGTKTADVFTLNAACMEQVRSVARINYAP